MFGADISWDDDRSQTVGERKVRKEQKRRGSPTESSARSVVSSHVSSHVSSQVSSSSRATIVVAEPTNPWGPPSNDGLQVTSAGRPTTRDTGHDSKGSSFREARTDAWLAGAMSSTSNGSGLNLERLLLNSSTNFTDSVKKASTGSDGLWESEPWNQSVRAASAHSGTKTKQDVIQEVETKEWIKSNVKQEETSSVVVKSVTIDVAYSPRPNSDEFPASKGEKDSTCAWSETASTGPTRVANHSNSPPRAPVRPVRSHGPAHYQRLARRMENASVKIMLQRMQELWKACPGTEGEVLERQLWAQTCLETPIFDAIAEKDEAEDDGAPILFSLHEDIDILVLDGHMADLHRLASVYSGSKIAHLTTQPDTLPAMLMPACVTHQSVQALPAVAHSMTMMLPYPDNSKHAVHAARLAARVPATLLPTLLRECRRVLRPGGVLELRLLDPSPERETLGPKLAAWLEARVLVAVETAFRCARPALLVPRWAREAGFVGVDGAAVPAVAMRRLRLPAAAGTADEDRVGAVGALALRDVWRAAWGEFVVPAEGESGVSWWWEDEEVVRECVERGTRWVVSKFVAMKAGGE